MKLSLRCKSGVFQTNNATVWVDESFLTVWRIDEEIHNYGGVGVRQNTTVLYPICYADGMFRPLWAIFKSQKYI